MDESPGTIPLLHVDDDPAFGAVVKRYLERKVESFEVATVSDAETALDRLTTDRFECVISDYELRALDGIQLLEAVRDRHGDLPFILFTGRGSEEVASDAIAAGVTDYLQKGTGTEQYTVLANRVRNAVEHVRAERLAAVTGSQMEAISEHTRDAILVIDESSQITYANPSVRTLFGYDPETLVGGDLTQLMPSDLANRHRDALARYCETGERTVNWEAVEFTAKHRTGAEVPVSISFSEFHHHGDRRFVGILRDVSKRVRQETTLRERGRMFRQLADSLDEVVWMTDPDTQQTLYVNPAYERLWGEPVQSLEDRPRAFLDAIHEGDCGRVERTVGELAADDFEVEYRIVHPDGAVRWVRHRGILIDEVDGETRHISLVTDVSETKERERELERQNERLQEFAEVLTHDLRNPLNIASGYHEIARESGDEGAMEKLGSALDRITELVDEVQQSIMEGSMELDERTVELAEVARDAWRTAETRNATLEIDGSLRLRADPQQLRRLLENLFRNAAEHGRSGGGDSLTVRVRVSKAGFSVEDDGVGLPPDVTDRVFERGFTTTRSGSGFGLAIVRKIAQRHGWEIALEESESGGAGFRFSQIVRSEESMIEMEAGGADIWGKTDEGHFAYERVTGNFDVSVAVPLVANTHAWAKGGVMVRSSADPTAAHAMVRRRPNGRTTVQWRPRSGDDALSLTSERGRDHKHGDTGEPNHDWLRLVREDGNLRAYSSERGAAGTWTLLVELHESDVALPDTVLVGLAGTSHHPAATTTIRFTGLQGIAPTANVDLGDPLRPGRIRTIQPSIVDVADPSDVSSTGMTMRGTVAEIPGDALEVRFDYREVMADEWSPTDTMSVAEPGPVSAEIGGLKPRRYYQYKLVPLDPDASLESSETVLVATPGKTEGEVRDGPRTTAIHDPGDGTARLAPWLDTDTPVITITQPDRSQLARALSIDGPRVVVFETSGTIDLQGRDLTISNDRCWIAAQTAPSPGITLVRGRLLIAGDECVVQHLRVRPGDGGEGVDLQRQGIQTGDETTDVIVDHCSVTWGVKEDQSIGHLSERTTFSNCLIAEALHNSTYPEGPRSFGSLVGHDATDVALLGNVWATNRGWNPRFSERSEGILANNLHYHYHDAVTVTGGARVHILGDVFRRHVGESMDVIGRGTVETGDPNHKGGAPEVALADTLTHADTDLEWPASLEVLPQSETAEQVLTHAGARPADRTPTDARVIEQVRTGTGEFLDSQEEVGGYPDIEEGSRRLEIPAGNLRAWLRDFARDVEPDR